jgi:DHA2 family multidrug resistance protein
MIQPVRKPIWLQLVLTFSFYVLMQLVITPDSGEEHLYWPLILRGVGLGLLFVPISTLSLSTLGKV